MYAYMALESRLHSAYAAHYKYVAIIPSGACIPFSPQDTVWWKEETLIRLMATRNARTRRDHFVLRQSTRTHVCMLSSWGDSTSDVHVRVCTLYYPYLREERCQLGERRIEGEEREREKGRQRSFPQEITNVLIGPGVRPRPYLRRTISKALLRVFGHVRKRC